MINFLNNYIKVLCPYSSIYDLFLLLLGCFSAHGLGTAALSSKEPEALPFCAIAYALNGIFGSLLCSVPAVRQSLLAVVG